MVCARPEFVRGLQADPAGVLSDVRRGVCAGIAGSAQVVPLALWHALIPLVFGIGHNVNALSVVHLVLGHSLSSSVGLRGVSGLPFTVTLQKKTIFNPCSLPSSTGDGERFIDCARRQRNLDSRRGGYLLRVLLHLILLLSAPLYGIFRLAADGARHGRSVTTVLFRWCF